MYICCFSSLNQHWINICLRFHVATLYVCVYMSVFLTLIHKTIFFFFAALKLNAHPSLWYLRWNMSPHRFTLYFSLITLCVFVYALLFFAIALHVSVFICFMLYKNNNKCHSRALYRVRIKFIQYTLVALVFLCFNGANKNVFKSKVSIWSISVNTVNAIATVRFSTNICWIYVCWIYVCVYVDFCCQLLLFFSFDYFLLTEIDATTL